VKGKFPRGRKTFRATKGGESSIEQREKVWDKRPLESTNTRRAGEYEDLKVGVNILKGAAWGGAPETQTSDSTAALSVEGKDYLAGQVDPHTYLLARKMGTAELGGCKGRYPAENPQSKKEESSTHCKGGKPGKEAQKGLFFPALSAVKKKGDLRNGKEKI